MTAPLVDDAMKRELALLYDDPGRHYHGLAHVNALLALALEYRPALSDPAAVDAVYDSRAKDNEARSAALARRKLQGRADAERLDLIAAMIEATATHEVPEFSDPAARRDTALFLDMDLSILGATPAAFEAYEQAVRREYGWVEESAWRAGRGMVLKSFLARPHIFHTDEFRRRFERQARENVTRSLATLEGGAA